MKTLTLAKKKEYLMKMQDKSYWQVFTSLAPPYPQPNNSLKSKNHVQKKASKILFSS
jgi:hypothetical protein